ncbi:hypothetical protein D3C83_81900 [compost metagenome]
MLLAYGELGGPDWFPHTSGGAVEAGLGVSYALAPPLWLEAELGFTRYFLSFHPETGDPSVVVTRRIAGGAIDQHYSGSLGAALRF